LLWPTDRINPGAYHRVQLGMTESEVQDAIGIPPLDRDDCRIEDFGFWIPDPRRTKGKYSRNNNSMRVWMGEEYWIAVTIDDAGTVIGAAWWESPDRKPPTFLDRLRARLGL
jgi:hypothetical protein